MRSRRQRAPPPGGTTTSVWSEKRIRFPSRLRLSPSRPPFLPGAPRGDSPAKNELGQMVTSGRSGATPPPRFASAALTTYGTRLAVAVLSFGSILIVARSLGPEGRGEVALLTAIATLSSQLAVLG